MPPTPDANPLDHMTVTTLERAGRVLFCGRRAYDLLKTELALTKPWKLVVDGVGDAFVGCVPCDDGEGITLYTFVADDALARMDVVCTDQAFKELFERKDPA